MTENQNNKAPSVMGQTFRDVLPIMLTEVVLTGLMIGVYALLGRLTTKVWLGAALGVTAALLNFTVMILCLLRAEKAQTPEKGQLLARGNYVIRLLVLAVSLFFLLRTGVFDIVAALLPLALMRIALFLPNLRKKE